MINNLIAIQTSNRIVELDRRQANSIITGDFDGSVTGKWVELGQYGEGKVKYNDKVYVTVPIGFVSIPKNTEVELTFANGIYYSKF